MSGEAESLGGLTNNETSSVASKPLAASADQAALFRFTDRLFRAEAADDIYDAALEAIVSALQCDRASILLFDDAGVIRFVASRGLSEQYRRAVTGHTPWQPGERDPEPITVADFEQADESPELKAIIGGEGIRALAFIPLVIDRRVIGKFMAYHNAPHAFTDHEIDLGLLIARQLGFAIERERARAAHNIAEQTRQRLSAIVESSEDAIVSKDLNGILDSWNKGAERLFGYRADEIIGKSVLTLIPPELQDEEPGIITRIRAGERIEHYETVRLRKDGQRIHVSLSVSPVKDASGTIIGASKIARDITERKRAEEQRTLLLNELNHRVKNTLATVQALAMQTLRSTENSDEARELFDSRLAALARAHDLLTAQNWEGARLHDVVERALSPFRTQSDRIGAQGPDVSLSPRQALALSIALHELATNAAKYGALSGEQGRIALSWRLSPTDGADQLDIKWCESDGPVVQKPARSGFGSRLIERNLARELGGAAKIEYLPTGVVASISTPLDAVRMVMW